MTPLRKKLNQLTSNCQSLKCGLCGKTGLNYKQYKRHPCKPIRLRENNISNTNSFWYCTECYARFSLRMLYMEHMRYVHHLLENVFEPHEANKRRQTVTFQFDLNVPSKSQVCHGKDTETTQVKQTKEESHIPIKHVPDQDETVLAIFEPVETDCAEEEIVQLKTVDENHKTDSILTESVNKDKEINPEVKCYKNKRNKLINQIEFSDEESNSHFFQHECSDCNQYYDNETLLRKHINEFHGTKKYFCKQCQAVYCTAEELEIHINEHNHPYCLACNKHIPDYCEMQQHVREHTEENIFICSSCRKVFKHMSVYLEHITSKHMTPDHTRSQCEICGKVYYNLQSLRNHQEDIHQSQGKSVLCEHCGKVVRSEKKLGKHKRLVHQKDLTRGKWFCPVCKKLFSSSTSLGMHKRQHTEENPYSCSLCKEAFKQKVLLRRHMKSKHNFIEPITTTCEICKKGFMNHIALKAHQNRTNHY